MKRINIWDLWAKEWKNASKFFKSKGDIKTRSRLKDKWFKDFKGMLMEIEKTVIENQKK